jgi:hypothetical protein
VCILSWVLALRLPSGSYVLFWPLLLSTIGLLVVELLRAPLPHIEALGTAVGTAVTLLIFVPLAYLLYIFLTLNLLSVAAAGLFLGLFFLICIPLINASLPQVPWRTVILLLLIASGVCLGAGALQSHSSAVHPRQDSLIYSLNADAHSAVWASYDKGLDPFTGQFLANAAGSHLSIPDFLTGSQQKVLSATAPVFDLQPPISEIKSDEDFGDLHHIVMNVRSQRDANLIMVGFDPSVKLISVRISGRILKIGPKSHGSIFLYGMNGQGVDLDLNLRAASGFSFGVSDS